MRPFHILSLAALSSFFPTNSFCSTIIPRQHKPPAFLLAGDSTTAPTGGWGDAFIFRLTNGAIGTNYGRAGGTTENCRSRGTWEEVLNHTSTLKETYNVYVPLQFGHDDQIPEHNISLSKFKDNLSLMIHDVLACNCTPILISPVARRTYKDGVIVESLGEHTAAVLEVAKAEKVLALDLNKKSTKYLNAIGPSDAHAYDWENDQEEGEHVNGPGAMIFGTMVSGLMKESKTLKMIGDYVGCSEVIWQAIQRGKFFLPSL